MLNEVKHRISNNACETAGEKLSDHFADIGKMVDLGCSAKKKDHNISNGVI